MTINREIPYYLALTGRVKDWLDSPSNRLPVSCTVFVVDDSMEGREGIEASWLFTSHGIRQAAGVAVDLSKLRASGSDNGKGLVSSGAASFAKFYSLINQELRRGGTFRNGAVTLFLDHDHGDAEEFLNLTSQELPWAKKALYVDENLATNPLLPLIAEKVNNGTLWLAKKQWNADGERLYSNVCMEIAIPSRGTCLLGHVNLGLIINPTELVEAFTECAEWMCQLHGETGIGGDGYYLKPENDKQVGLGVIGLANMLALNNVTYEEFAIALDYVSKFAPMELNSIIEGINPKALEFAVYIDLGFKAATKVGKKYGMDRLFTVAPTASSSYRHVDAQGFTTAPEISPPLDYEVDRDSGTFGVKTFEYHPQTEIAMNVGWDIQWKLMNAWQALMDNTGLAHTMSANLWSTQFIDEDWIIKTFMPSKLKTTYYRIAVDNAALDKSEIATVETIEEAPDSVACPLIRLPQDDPNWCEACSG